jgi:hypothetical protein
MKSKKFAESPFMVITFEFGAVLPTTNAPASLAVRAMRNAANIPPGVRSDRPGEEPASISSIIFGIFTNLNTMAAQDTQTTRNAICKASNTKPTVHSRSGFMMKNYNFVKVIKVRIHKSQLR